MAPSTKTAPRSPTPLPYPGTEALREYTHALIPWQLGHHFPTAPVPKKETCPDRELKAALRPPREHVLLLGLGDGALAAALAKALPAERTLTVCTLNPADVRPTLAEQAPWWSDGRHTILADTSPRAILLLLHAFGRNPAQCTMILNSTLSEEERQTHRALQRLLLKTERLEPDTQPALSGNPEDVTIAAILHPDEPRLEEFFAAIPAWAREMIVVWDADAPPTPRPDAACPTRHLARRLNKDFAAQRNVALAHAQGEWIFFLDSDERLAAEDWAALPGLTARARTLGAGGVAWPRMTFWPDEEHVLAGFGLWPDLQLRLMPVSPGLRFERPVHEVVVGLPGPVLIDAGRQIRHYSRLFKNPEALAAKLRVFDGAAGQRLHRLNDTYPTLPTEFMRRVSAAFRHHALLRLRAL